MSVRNNSVSHWVGVIVVLLLFSRAENTDAAMLALTSLSGAISYGYGYSRSSGGGAGESQAITGSISGTGFYWQPWFISYSAALSGGFTRADSSTSTSSSNSKAWSGSLGLNVFPVSRFPFSLTLSHTNSLLENSQPIGTSSRAYTSTRLMARQSYLANSGYNSHLTWSHGRFHSQDSTSTSDVVTADTRKTFTSSSILAQANYSTSENSSSNVKPQNWGAQLSHNYIPGNQFGVANFVSTSGAKATTVNSETQSQTSQASSSFSWRPEYKPYTFSGGMRVAYSENSQKTTVADNQATSSVASLSLGLNYRLSRKVAVLVTGGGSGGYDKNDASESNHSTADASLSTSYSSDQYSLLGLLWGWSAGGGIGGTTTRTSGNTTQNNGSETTASGGLNLSHHGSRNWSVGRATVLGFSFSNSYSGTWNDERLGGVGTGLGVSLSGSTRGRSGSSFAGLSVSGSASESESRATDGTVEKTNSTAAFSSFNISRNQTINRLSALTATLGVQASVQAITNQDTVTNRTANGNLSYRHLRAFGIYSLNYSSTASYSVLFNQNQDRTETMYWQNSFQYNVGLLDMALDIDLRREGIGTTQGSLRFRATRTF